MGKVMNHMIAIVVLVVGATKAARGGEDWTPLFNGKDLAGWDRWLGRPDAGRQATTLARNYTETSTLPDDQREKVLDSLDLLFKSLSQPVGLNRDPFEVYKVVAVDKQPAIRITGQVFGAITTQAEFENYHLKLEFKWGQKKWPPRETAVRDSGLLYHCVGPHGAAGTYWMKSQELQIQEKDCGDYWSVAGGIVDVEVDKTKGGYVYKKGGEKLTFPSKATGPRVIKSPDAELPSGQWNTIELLAVGGTSVHIVNGKVVMVLTGSRHAVDGKETPLTKGKIQIQSEGAEVFYRNIAMRPLTAIPEKYLR